MNEAQRKLAVLLEEIKESTKIAETKKAEVLEQKEKLSARAEIIEGQKREAEQDLAAAEPALRAAVDALNAITPGELWARLFEGGGRLSSSSFFSSYFRHQKTCIASQSYQKDYGWRSYIASPSSCPIQERL